jgi:hypothetical protein
MRRGRLCARASDVDHEGSADVLQSAARRGPRQTPGIPPLYPAGPANSLHPKRYFRGLAKANCVFFFGVDVCLGYSFAQPYALTPTPPARNVLRKLCFFNPPPTPLPGPPRAQLLGTCARGPAVPRHRLPAAGEPTPGARGRRAGHAGPPTRTRRALIWCRCEDA